MYVQRILQRSVKDFHQPFPHLWVLRCSGGVRQEVKSQEREKCSEENETR